MLVLVLLKQEAATTPREETAEEVATMRRAAEAVS